MVAVVIPLYKDIPSSHDLISLDRCFTTLSDFPLIVVKPQNLNLEFYPYQFSQIISLENDWFSDIASYNKLMTSSKFYELFLDYKYILIHQTDAFVFKNELREWCLKGYDYIGAPWLRRDFSLINYFKGHLYKLLNIPKLYHLENKVGNGGLSLRKTAVFWKYCKEYSHIIQSYLSKEGSVYNEDVFWSIEINRECKKVKVPDYKEAVCFAIESCPDIAVRLTKGELPFGCHAWDRNIDFFRPIFLSYGYKI